MAHWVEMGMLCEYAANCLGHSYQKEHSLLLTNPYPFREIQKVQALQKLCLTILRLSKFRPKKMVEIPVTIWNDIQSGCPCSVAS